jgi:hypothetical protein
MRWLLKRWWFWAGAGFMLVALVVGYFAVPVGGDRISQVSCDRIQPGMTLKDVESLLGDDCLPHGGSITSFLVVSWFDDDRNVITVAFKPAWEDDEVTAKEFHRTKLPFQARLKRRIQRRIRALWP